MKKIFLMLLFSALLCNISAQTSPKNDNQRYFDINKNLDIFNSVFKELHMFYVDSIPTDKMMQSVIENTLAGLDPYTEYYAENNMDDLRMLTTGEYAGIGAVISYNNGQVIINQPYENMPAAKSGLKAADAILEIDGIDMRKANVKDVSDKLKGTPGTTVTLLIQRPGENKPRTIKVVREKITINPVTYSAINDSGTGYIHFSGFTENSSKEFRKAFLDLKDKGAQSLIIDLRGNGGGILEEAVSIANLFIPKDQEIVSTKGKIKQWDRTYKTSEQPIDTLIPIAVLTDTGSASASEILAGSMQDLDRGVIIGNRTFGKGLVQTTRMLPYNGNLKITTAKYYIPSGRCIQVLDYSHRNPDGSVARVPDSLTNVFYTRNGREVRDGGGINPDFIITEDKPGTITYYLITQNIVFDFVTDWVLKHPQIASPDKFSLTNADYEAFKQFVKSKKDFKYDQMSAHSLRNLEEVMKFEGYMDVASAEFQVLKAKLVPDLDRDLELFKESIKDVITNEIIQRYYFQKGVLIHTLQNDKAYQKAVEVLNDKSLYNDTLKPEKSIASSH
ncbi:MAG TPA: S41 family peptidase [Dysgonamonadaceae bacterium]|nr:S41 family peptidase [Dysgonamonadaceae bacterium]